MTHPSDQYLAQRVRQGDEGAFVQLIRRHERTLAALIRYRVGPGEQVQDVLQETLVRAWSALRRATPRDVRAWLLQVARNRCRDYFRSTQRRELFVESGALAPMVNRLGVALARQREVAADIVEAMEEVPERERAALQAFYLDGLSIAEIAARHRSPSGTIKRRLSHGREQIRAVLGVTRQTRSKTMSRQTVEQGALPQYQPEIRIEPSREKPFRIDFKEMAWWFVVPEVGDRVRYGSYEPLVSGDGPWRLSEIVSLEAVSPAVIHGRPCVQVELGTEYFDREGMIFDKTPGPEKGQHVRAWGSMSEESVEWVAVESLEPADGTRELLTFLDEDFQDDWGGEIPRRLEDCGHLQQRADGFFSKRADTPQMVVAGAFEVYIGERHFTCVRVFEIEDKATERDTMIESYMNREGRTVLFRRYNGNHWGKRDEPPQKWGAELTWAEDLPHNNRITIDGVNYVHWYDCLSDAACGLTG